MPDQPQPLIDFDSISADAIELVSQRDISRKESEEEKSNRVFIYRSEKNQYLPGLGSFHPVRFSTNKKDMVMYRDGFKPILNKQIFCYVLENGNELNVNWKNSRRFEFSIIYKIEFERLQSWFLGQRRNGKVLSSFFTK